MKRLYRLERQKVFGGVCTGLGEYFNIDPVIIRTIFLLGFFSPLPFGLLYLILWVLTPII